jgi:hypothetical protein
MQNRAGVARDDDMVGEIMLFGAQASNTSRGVWSLSEVIPDWARTMSKADHRKTRGLVFVTAEMNKAGGNKEAIKLRQNVAFITMVNAWQCH